MFQRLLGLPPYGPTAKLIPDGWGHGVREGLVVEFQRSDGTAWVGNFEPRLGGLDDVVLHPNGIDTLVASSGQLWSMDATTEAVHRLAPAVFSVWALAEPRRLLFSNQALAFLCVGPQGVIWRTRRISWDGFQKIRLDKDVPRWRGLVAARRRLAYLSGESHRWARRWRQLQRARNDIRG